MKNAVFFLVLLVLAGCRSSGTKEPADSTERAVFTPKNPVPAKIITLKNVVMQFSEEGRTTTDTLQLPQVKDGYPALQQVLNSQAVLGGDALADVVANYAECGCGITALKTAVTFQSAEVISLLITTRYMGAYPSESETYRTLDVKTGRPYQLDAEISEAGKAFLLRTYQEDMRKRIDARRKTYAAEAGPDGFSTIGQSLDTLKAATLAQQFVFTNDALIVHTENVMPHAAEALEPDRRDTIAYSRLRPYKTNSARVLN